MDLWKRAVQLRSKSNSKDMEKCKAMYSRSVALWRQVLALRNKAHRLLGDI